MAANVNHASASRDRTRLRAVHRELWLLAVLVAVAVAGFLLTRAVAAGNERMRRQDAASWDAMGRRDLEGGHTAEAVAAFQRAASKAPDNKAFVLGLAAALAADHQDDTAKQVLGRLRDIAPEDEEVNLHLARLEAHHGDFTLAIRYYENALNALWRPEQSATRRRLRAELVRLLLDHDQRSHALSELLMANADVPDDATAQTDAGRLFLEAGDPRRALDRFARALALEPQNGQALAGAGAAAFVLGDYARARRYLAAAPDHLDRVVELRTLSDLVLTDDPMAPRLALARRTGRLIADLHQAGDRLSACLSGPPPDRPAAPSDLDALQRDLAAFEPTLTPRAMLELPDTIESGVDLVYRVEKAMEQGCGAPAPIDRALVLIGQLHGFGER